MSLRTLSIYAVWQYKGKVQVCIRLGKPSGQDFFEVDGRIIPHGKAGCRRGLSERNSKKTTEIINKIRTGLYNLLTNLDESQSELMSKALNYLKN